MDLFVNVATGKKQIIFFDEKQILEEVQWTEAGRESKWVLPTISNFAKSYGDNFGKDLESITIVNGPGSFTGIRVAVSVLNTLLFIYPHISAYQLNVGEFFAALSKEAYNLLLFQVYESDTFAFEPTGVFSTRIAGKEIPEEWSGKTCTGEVLPSMKEALAAHDSTFIPLEIGDFTPGMLNTLKEAAKKTEKISPFYGKGANITTPKKK